MSRLTRSAAARTADQVRTVGESGSQNSTILGNCCDRWPHGHGT